MKFLFVVAHPETHGQSFNHALFHEAQKWCQAHHHECQTTDLYASPAFNAAFLGPGDFKALSNPAFFKPQAEQAKRDEIAAIKEEQKKVEWCETMVFFFPLYWFSVPAILKSWIERVFGMGWAYGGGHIYHTGTCHGKQALCVTTTGGGQSSYSTPQAWHGDLEKILYHVTHGFFLFCGFTPLQTTAFFSVAHVDATTRASYLKQLTDKLQAIADKKYPAIAYHPAAAYEGMQLKAGHAPDLDTCVFSN